MAALERIKARHGFIVQGELEELVSEGHGHLPVVCKLTLTHERIRTTVAALADQGVGDDVREVYLPL